MLTMKKILTAITVLTITKIETSNVNIQRILPIENDKNHILEQFVFEFMEQYFTDIYCISCFLTQNLPETNPCMEFAFHPPVRSVMIFPVPKDDTSYVNTTVKLASKHLCYGHIISVVDNITLVNEILHQAAKWDNVQRNAKFIIGPVTSMEEMKNIFSFEGVEVLPNIIVFLEMKSTSDVPWYQVYTWNMEKDRIVYPLLNEWSYDKKFANYKDMVFRKTQNMRGRNLKIAIWGYPPSTVVTMEGGKVVIDGTEMRMMKEFGRRLNFTWTVIVVDHQDWGVVDEFGNATGILKECVLSTVDICLAGMYIDYNSTWFVNHTIPYRRTFMTFITPIPPPYASWMALVMPFSFMMWVGTAAFLICSTVVLLSVARLNAKLLPQEPRSRYCKYQDCVLHTISLLSQIGMPEEPVQPAVRHFTLWLLVTFILLTTCYGGGLLTFLTNPPTPPPVDTIPDMVRVNLKWGAIENYMELVLMESLDPVARKLRYTFELHKNESELLERMKQMDFGIAVEYIDVGYLSYIEYVPQDLLEHFHLLSESAITGTTSVMLRMGFPWKAWFDRVLYIIIEAGLITMWEQDVVRGMHKMQMTQWLQNMNRQPDTQPEPKSLSVGQLQGAFFFLMIGLGFSLGEFVFELRSHMYAVSVKFFNAVGKTVHRLISYISKLNHKLCSKPKANPVSTQHYDHEE